MKDALVYGRNGVGKTNLARAILDARYNVAMDSLGYRSDTTFLNVDGDLPAASFSYLFGLGGKEILYEYTKNARGILRSERLEMDGEPVYDVDGEGNCMGRPRAVRDFRCEGNLLVPSERIRPLSHDVRR